jgi:CRP-like cAMP-binding protein
VLTEEQIIQELRDTRLFSRLNRSQLRVLSRIVHEVEYKANQTVYRQGEPGSRYYIVYEGGLRLTRVDAEGRVQHVGTLGEQSAFGETSLLLGDLRDATVKAIEPSTLLYIERVDFRQVLEEHPSIENNLNIRPDLRERWDYPEFPWLEEMEYPIKVVRKHPAVLLTSLLIPGGLVLVLVLAGLIAQFRLGNVALIISLVVALVPFLAGLYLYIDWRNDVYVVTNQRTAHRERIGIFREMFSAAPLKSIDNIAQVQVGFLAGVLEYGDLIMEMTGEGGQVVFRSVPHPEQIQNLIYEQIERTKAQERAQERVDIEQAMRRHLGQDEGEREEADTREEGVKEKEESRRWGFLGMLPGLLRSLLPPTWHKEGNTITWRKHWVALLKPIAVPFLIFSVITLALLIVAFLDPNLIQLLLLPYAGALLILVPWLMWQFEDWQNDFYQVTFTRLIHVERLPFFLREERRESPLDSITNVRFDQTVVGRFLGYGDVVVETAAITGDFFLRYVHRPEEVQREIFSHMSAYQRYLRRQEAERHREELLDWFSVYEDIRRARSASSEEGA